MYQRKIGKLNHIFILLLLITITLNFINSQVDSKGITLEAGPSADFFEKINILDIAGPNDNRLTAVVDPNVPVEGVFESVAQAKCSILFQNLLKSVPYKIQKVILDNFTKANSTHCCDSSTFLKEINEVNSLIVSDFTSLVSKETRKTRSGLSCMRGGEIYKKKLDLIPEKGKEEFKKEQKKNREFIRTLTKQGNIMNQKLLNCTEEVLSYVNTKLSFMCFDNLFVKKDGKYSQPKDISESLLILDDACSPYLKQFNIFTDIVLNGYVDTVYNQNYNHLHMIYKRKILVAYQNE